MTAATLPMTDTAYPSSDGLAAPEAIPIPAADLLPVQRHATPAFRVAKPLIGGLLHSVFSLHVEGRENVPRDANVVAVCNHLQWIDAAFVLAGMPAEPRVHAMGDPTDAIRKGPRFWWLLRQIGGIIPIDRSHHGDTVLFDTVQHCLEVGGSVMLFPEGRCGEAEGEMLPWKKGFAHFALRGGVPVLPMALTGTRDLWLRKRITLRIGEPIDVSGMDVDEIVELVRERVAQLMAPYRPGHGPRLLRRRLTRLF